MNISAIILYFSILFTANICNAQFCNLTTENVTLAQWQDVIAKDRFTLRFTDTVGIVFTPTTFVFLHTPQTGDGITYRTENGALTADMKKAIRKAAPGDMYFFFAETRKISVLK